MNAKLSVVAIGLLAVAAMATPGLAAAPNKYDGKRWLSVSASEREGFVSGYYDCYTYDYRGRDRYDTKSWAAYQRSVTTFYQDEPGKEDVPFSTVLHQLRDQPGKKPDPTCEVMPGPHGYFDGTYWKQISQEKNKQVGFIEGYLSCLHIFESDKYGFFSMPPPRYAVRITHWYGLTADGDIIEARERVKVADVLYRIRNAP